MISTLFISLLLWQVDTDQLLSLLRTINIQMLLFALFILILSAILNSFRWFILVKDSDLKFSFPKILLFNFTGLFFSIFLPGRTGGDIARAYYIAKSSDNRAKAISTIIIWRIIGIIALTIIALIASFIAFPLLRDKSVIIAVLAMILFIYTVLFSLTNKKLMLFLIDKFSVLLNILSKLNLESKLKTLYDALQKYQEQKKMLLMNIALGTVTHLLIIIAWYIISRSLDINISYVFFFLLIPIIGLLNTIPFSLN